MVTTEKILCFAFSSAQDTSINEVSKYNDTGETIKTKI